MTDETRSRSGVRIDDQGWGRYLDTPLACPRNRVRYTVSHQLGPGVGLCVLLLAGAGGDALTAVAHGAHHDSVGASTAMFGAIGILAATRVMSRGRRPAARKLWMVVAASLALLALLGTNPGSDLLAHLFGLLLGGAVGLAPAPTLPHPVRPPLQWAFAVAVLAVVVGAWLRAVS